MEKESLECVKSALLAVESERAIPRAELQPAADSTFGLEPAMERADEDVVAAEDAFGGRGQNGKENKRGFSRAWQTYRISER